MLHSRCTSISVLLISVHKASTLLGKDVTYIEETLGKQHCRKTLDGRKMSTPDLPLTSAPFHIIHFFCANSVHSLTLSTLTKCCWAGKLTVLRWKHSKMGVKGFTQLTQFFCFNFLCKCLSWDPIKRKVRVIYTFHKCLLKMTAMKRLILNSRGFGTAFKIVWISYEL